MILKEVDGGAERDRTADLDIANVALSQLSYGPASTNEDQSVGARKAPALKSGGRMIGKAAEVKATKPMARLRFSNPSATGALTCAGKKPPVG